MGIIIKTIVSLFVFSGGVAALLYLNKKQANVKLINYILSGAALLFYLLLILFDGQYPKWDAATIRDVNPLSKMSPFIFATVFFVNFAPSIIKKHYYTILSTLIIAMTFVGIFASLADGIMNDMNYFVVWMYFDSFSHIAIALLGLWLILSGQITFERKTLFISLGILYSFLFLLIVVNLIFKTHFFGFSVYGDHDIYGIVINPWILSFVAYFVGLTALVVSGWFLAKAIARKRPKITKTEQSS